MCFLPPNILRDYYISLLLLSSSTLAKYFAGFVCDSTAPCVSFLITENLFFLCDLRFYFSEFPVAISSRFISASSTPHFYYADPICMTVCDIFQMLQITFHFERFFFFPFGTPENPERRPPTKYLLSIHKQQFYTCLAASKCKYMNSTFIALAT